MTDHGDCIFQGSRRASRRRRPLSGTGLLVMLVLAGGAACVEREPVELEFYGVPPVTPMARPVPPPREYSAPPPISGGTLLVTRDDALVVAADPDRDSVWIVDAAKDAMRTRVRLAAGSEPGRVIEDQEGKIHVVLRRSGEVAKIDPQSGTVLSLRSVCPAPRGLAHDAATDDLYVVCASGELVTMKASGGAVLRRLFIDRDLRDVVVKGDHLLISRFRSAELIEVDAAGYILGRVSPRTATIVRDPFPNPPMGAPVTATPSTAWRMVPLPGGGALMLHQRGQVNSVTLSQPGGYGRGACGNGTGLVTAGVTRFSGATRGAADILEGAMIPAVALAVDVAVSRDGERMALISADLGFSPGNLRAVPVVTKAQLSAKDPCTLQKEFLNLVDKSAGNIAGAFDGRSRLWVQSRQPAKLERQAAVGSQETLTIPLLDAEDRRDEGLALFHTVTRACIACASCHAEAGDDGLAWDFERIGPRRTQSLRGGLLASAPFHWDGDMQDLNAIMDDVFMRRMQGDSIDSKQIAALGQWLDAQPALPKSPPRNGWPEARGKALFESAEVGCKGCHGGALLTNNVSVDVGTSKAFQVPALRELSERAPYMHNGCARTLRARFDPTCGGGDKHGKTSQLTPAELDDLVAYLETL